MAGTSADGIALIPAVSTAAKERKNVLRFIRHGRRVAASNYGNFAPHLAEQADYFLFDPAVRHHPMDAPDVSDHRQASASELGCVCNHRHFPGCPNHLRV